MNNQLLITYGWCMVGIILSIVLPILRAMLPAPPPRDAQGNLIGGSDFSFWSRSRPFLIIGLFSALTAILIVALGGENLKLWGSAVLAGYAWDSTLQKLARP